MCSPGMQHAHHIAKMWLANGVSSLFACHVTDNSPTFSLYCRRGWPCFCVAADAALIYGHIDCVRSHYLINMSPLFTSCSQCCYGVRRAHAPAVWTTTSGAQLPCMESMPPCICVRLTHESHARSWRFVSELLLLLPFAWRPAANLLSTRLISVMIISNVHKHNRIRQTNQIRWPTAITVHLLRIYQFARAMHLRNTRCAPRALSGDAIGDDCSVVFFLLLLGPIGEPMSGRAHTCASVSAL